MSVFTFCAARACREAKGVLVPAEEGAGVEGVGVEIGVGLMG